MAHEQRMSSRVPTGDKVVHWTELVADNADLIVAATVGEGAEVAFAIAPTNEALKADIDAAIADAAAGAGHQARLTTWFGF